MAGLTTAIGLMSGTSMDGIDVALIRTDGEHAVERGPSRTYAYPPEFRAAIMAAVTEARTLTCRTATPGMLADFERALTKRHADVVDQFLKDHALEKSSVDLLGFHGQTVLHRPEERLTVQLGDGDLLARSTGIDVVYDLRAADVAAGGQGAPLAPVYHRALATKLPDRPAAFLNIGGVANVTWIGRNGQIAAFDTGPGNALIDDWLMRHTGRSFDQDGALALSGSIDEDALIHLLTHDYFGVAPPKSLDRNTFSLDPVAHLSPADGAATLTAFTAAAVQRALAVFPEHPTYWVVCGGGRRNKALMMALAGQLNAAVVPVEAVGLNGDAMEAEAWAYLAVRSLKGLPVSFPGTTGVAEPMTGGVLAKGR